MINIFLNGALISFLYLLNHVLAVIIPRYMDFVWNHVTMILLTIKLIWVVQNHRKSLKDYIIFSIIFSLIIITLVSSKLQIFPIIKQTFFFLNSITYWLELIIFFICFLLFSEKFSILQCLYLQMLTSVIVFFIKEIALPHKWAALGVVKISLVNFSSVLDNFLYFFHSKTIYSYYYNSFFFNTLTTLFYFNALTNIKNLDFKNWDQLWKPQPKIIYVLFFLIFSLFISNYWFPNLYWLKIQMDLLIILLIYMQDIGRFIFINYVASKVPRLNRMAIFVIIYFLTDVFVGKANQSVVRFLLGFFAYMLDVILNLY